MVAALKDAEPVKAVVSVAHPKARAALKAHLLAAQKAVAPKVALPVVLKDAVLKADLLAVPKVVVQKVVPLVLVVA